MSHQADRTDYLIQPPDVRAYLAEYYSELSAENASILLFLAEAFALIGKKSSLLEVGGGATVYQLISATEAVDRIAFTDLDQASIDAVIAWSHGDPDAFDWSHFVKAALRAENRPDTDRDVCDRSDRLREKLASIGTFDVFGEVTPESFDVVSAHFLLDSIGPTWKDALEQLVIAVRPNGWLVLSVTLENDYYKVGSTRLAASGIQIQTLVEALEERGLRISCQRLIDADVLDRSSERFKGYASIVCLLCHKGIAQ